MHYPVFLSVIPSRNLTFFWSISSALSGAVEPSKIAFPTHGNKKLPLPRRLRNIPPQQNGARQINARMHTRTHARTYAPTRTVAYPPRNLFTVWWLAIVVVVVAVVLGRLPFYRASITMCVRVCARALPCPSIRHRCTDPLMIVWSNICRYNLDSRVFSILKRTHIHNNT